MIRTFLISDIRGYSTFTRERGDETAARLAKTFADLARDVVEARGGRVIGLRGDEWLAVFESPPQAVRADPALGLAHGERYTHVHRTLHLSGPDADLDRIARATLKVGLADISAAFSSR